MDGRADGRTDNTHLQQGIIECTNEAYITKDGPVGSSPSVCGVQHSLDTGLVVLGCMHASQLEGICRQDLALAVHPRVGLCV